MKTAPPTPKERRRLEVLWEYEVLDTPPETVLDDLTELAAQTCETPIALISLVDEKRQWFKSRVGLSVTETSRDISICAHAIRHDDLFIVPDATLDERFADNPLVTADPHIRFYAGMPLRSPEGEALGALCVIDHVPRELTSNQQQSLRILSRLVMVQLELRRRTRRLTQLEAAQDRSQVIEHSLRLSEKALRQANRQLRMMTHCIQALIRATDEIELLATICRTAVVEGGYRMAWVGYAEDDQAKTVRPVAYAGSEEGYLNIVNITWADRERGRGPVGTAIRSGRPCPVQNVGSDPCFEPWREEAAKRGYAAVCALPLKAAGRTLGALAIYSSKSDAFDAREVALLDEFAGDLSFGIAALRGQCDHRRAEEQLRESERKYRDLVEHANSIILRWTPDETITFMNEFGLRFFGFSAEELIGHSVMDTIVPETEGTGRNLRPLIDQIRANPKAFERNVNENQRRSGERVWIAWTNKAECDDQGRIREILSIGSDITERKRVEDALEVSERDYREIFNATADAIFIHDAATGEVLQVNDPMLRMYGYDSEQEVRALSAAQLSASAPPYSLADAQALIRKALEEGPQVVEWLATRKNGERFWVEVSLRSSAIGGQDRVLAVVRDISERKRVEEAHTRLSTAVDQAAEAIVITDASGLISYVNPAFEQITGYSRREVLGRNPRILKSGKHDAAFYRQLWETIARGDVWSGHIINRRRGGELFEEVMTISPVRNSAGEIVNFVAVKRDVTQEVAMEAQLRQSQKMEAIGQLSGGVAHDFNNLLTVIQGHVSLLEENAALGPELRESVVEIGHAAERAASLTRQLLAFSRRQRLQPVSLDLNEVVANMTKMLKRILGEDITMHLHYAPHPAVVLADASMVEQVLLNLAVNARDAMPQGGRLVVETSLQELDERDASQMPQSRPGSYVCLSVSDTGSGIPPDVLPRIFDPFFTTKDVGRGTGLGLATVYGIVQQHQGWIDATSEVGQGATFRIYWPRQAIVEAQQTAEAQRINELPRGSETILLVEDEPALRSLVRSVLTRLGYRIVEAESGFKALEVWRESGGQIQLLLTDLVMPDGVSGRELAGRLQQDQPSLRVIYTSGYSAEMAGRDALLEAGANFLPKPFAPQKLAEMVRRILDQPLR